MNRTVKRILTVILLILAFTAVSGAFADYDIKASYGRVSRDLEKARGLKFKNTVPYSVKTRDELRQFLISTFKQELPPQKLRAMDATLKAFGFVSSDFKMWEFLINLYTEQVAGLYDFRGHRMLLMKEPIKIDGEAAAQMAMLKAMGIELTMEDLLLLHEMDHALQDQHFNLKELIGKVEGKQNDDYVNAVQSLIEGDATLVMMYAMFDKMGAATGAGGEELAMMIDMKDMRDQMVNAPMQGANMEQFSKAPLFFRRSLIFPYAEGMVFVDALKKKGGWALVNKAYKHHPKSTEHILHVEKYLGGDDPILIQWKKLPKTLGNYKHIEDNTAGELMIRLLMEQFASSADYRVAAEGWGGDRYRLFGDGNDFFFVWYTSWDRQQDAREFMAAYLELLKKRYPQIVWTNKVEKKAYLGRVNNRHYYCAINGKDVMMLDNIPENLTRDLIKTAWDVDKKLWK